MSGRLIVGALILGSLGLTGPVVAANVSRGLDGVTVRVRGSAPQGSPPAYELFTDPPLDLPVQAGQHARRAPEDTWPAPRPRFPLGSTFELQSLPGANVTLFLDFDGATLTGTRWNETLHKQTLRLSPYDRDGQPGVFNDKELAHIQHAWEVVAADFAPFNVNVTTAQPSAAALAAASPAVRGT